MTTGRLVRSAILLAVVALAIVFAVRWVRRGGEVARENDPLAAYERALDQRIAALRDAPGLAARLDVLSPEDQRVLVLELALQGIPRLPDAALVQRAFLVGSLLSGLDERTCGAVVTGHAAPARLARAIASLAPGARDAWLDLTAAAVRAELAQTPEPFVEPGPVREAIAALMSRRTPEQAQQLQRGLSKLRDLDPAEACRVGRAIYQEVPVLGAPHDQVLARLLAKP
jgi:hypothetical protein